MGLSPAAPRSIDIHLHADLGPPQPMDVGSMIGAGNNSCAKLRPRFLEVAALDAAGRTRCWRRACLGRIGANLAERRQQVVQSVGGSIRLSRCAFFPVET